jgi:hypothetical protein
LKLLSIYYHEKAHAVDVLPLGNYCLGAGGLYCGYDARMCPFCGEFSEHSAGGGELELGFGRRYYFGSPQSE